MEKRLSYILVGSFVIILTLSLFSFLYWLAKYGNETVAHDYYYTYFTESVSGLSVESPVKYRGVEVGRVQKISINKKNSEEVKVLLEIKKGTPIKKDTYAMLDTQGITGLKYIELRGGSKNSPLIVDKKGEIETIKSKKSIMASLFDSSEDITKKVGGVLQRVETVLSDKNIKNFGNIVTNLSSTTEFIEKNKQRLTQMFDEISTLNKNVQKDLNVITENINSLSKESKEFLIHTKDFEDKITPSFEKLAEMSDKAGAASDSTKIYFDNMQKELERGEFNFADIVEKNMQILNETSLSLKNFTIKLDGMIDELKNSPSDLLYKSTKKIPGPGEENE
jgi:phospholipid/cholesterol/gamma-HCH transport system substrate-binding protein